MWGFGKGFDGKNTTAARFPAKVSGNPTWQSLLLQRTMGNLKQCAVKMASSVTRYVWNLF